MSLKPIKRSDAKKDWCRPRRDAGRLVEPEYHLIATEGECTEPNYFSGLRDDLDRRYRNHIRLEINGIGLNTIALVKKVRKFVKNTANLYRHVWIVYDADDFPADNVNAVVELCDSYSSEGDGTVYHAIWSNECFELWFLLHWEYLQANISRQEYFTKIDKYIQEAKLGRYAKNRSDMYDILRPRLCTAVANAKKLAKLHEGKQPSSSKPGTMVFSIIEKLEPYLGKL